ncbi:MAG: mevalonate kinase [Deltaproteobacteria bacterium]|nr:mevalonate kinase [Deltaproteobacteria bacterium]
MIGRGRAPGKVILAGEHFVVHGGPAIALPVRAVRKEIEIDARLDPYDHTLELRIMDAFPEHDTLREMLVTLLGALVIPTTGEIRITVRSDLTPGAHLGSSAALAVALVRAVLDFRGLEYPDDEVARLAFELERIVHKNPSGIDNTVIALDRPIWFRKGHTPEPIACGLDATLLLADTGVASSTAEVVARVGDFRRENAERFARLIAEAEAVTTRLRAALATGDARGAGECLDHNQALLAEVGTSSPELESLIAAARAAGALGAKLTGGGGGGNAIALAAPEAAARVKSALVAAGARGLLEVPLADFAGSR